MNDFATIEQPVKELVLPRPHYIARLVRANETYMLAGRGTFKTTRGIALYVIDMIYEMPRSTGAGFGLSFEHLDTNTIPPLLHAFEEFGFRNGEHYVVGKKPPAHWPRPYSGILNDKYERVLSWHNGTAAYMVSLTRRAGANALSVQWGFFDEAKFMNEQVLIDEIFPIFRGNEETKKRFQHSSGYLSKFFATDKQADPVSIKWLLKKRKLQDQRAIEIVITLQLHLNELKITFNKAGVNARQKMRPQIAEIEIKLAKLRSSLVHVVEVSAYDVLYAHGEKWLKDKKRNSSEHDFKVIFENKDPDTPGQSFYPDFDPLIHCYTADDDIDPNKPLIIASDYQHSIAPIAVCQVAKLPGIDNLSLNYVDNVYAMPDYKKENLSEAELLQVTKGELQEAAQLFCDRFRHHPTKKVFYIFDQTATGRRVNADQYFVMVKKILRKNGWKVIDVYTGEVPEHYMKHQDTREWLTHSDAGTMAIRIHRRCTKLIISITGAAAETKNGQTKKRKKDETEATLDQSETTHFSDCFDMINHAVLKLRRIKQISTTGRAVVR
jgi:hypothetical protein